MPEALTYEHLVSILTRPGAVALEDTEWRAAIADAEAHGVLSLIAEAPSIKAGGAQLASLVRPAIVGQTALSVVRQRELHRVLDGLAGVGARPIVFKGAHLAFTIYPSPRLRPFLDVDVLVRPEERLAIDAQLLALGYERVPQVSGWIAFGQQQYWRVDESGAGHTLDLHWRLANPQAFAGRITYADLAEQAEPIPRLGPHAWGPCRWMALLIACVHRTAHHGNSDRLIWLYDIHLLASSLSGREWEELAGLAGRRGLGQVLAAGLDDSSECFGPAAPDRLQAELQSHRASDRDLSEFLAGPRSRFAVAASDWRRIERWGDRVTFVREHLLPPPSYMVHRYGMASPLALPWLYLRRIIAGAGKWAADARHHRREHGRQRRVRRHRQTRLP